MMRVRSCFVVIIGLAVGQTTLDPKCCGKKKVGGKSYSLVDQGAAVPDECKNPCIYSEDDYPDNHVCFAPGPLKSTCLSDIEKDPPKFNSSNCPNYELNCNLANKIDAPVETVQTPTACGQYCQTKSECLFWVMIPIGKAPNASCFFLSDCREQELLAGRVSGDYTCPPNTTLGNDVITSCPTYDTSCIAANNIIKQTDQPVTTPNECGKACKENNEMGGGCQYWTMIPEFLPDANCHLLDSCNHPIHSQRDVSGNRKCPPA